MAHAAAENGENNAACVECGHVYQESRPCSGLAELEIRDSLTPTSERPRQRHDPDDGLKWINVGGSILRSSKTAAVQAQIEKWLEDEPRKKIIIFSQFHTLYVLCCLDTIILAEFNPGSWLMQPSESKSWE